MSAETPDSFGHYLAAWNARDTSAVRALLEKSVSHDVTFIDPANQVAGIDELERIIREARVSYPEAAYVVVTGIDGHHHRFRYRWEARLDATTTVPGMDVTTVDEAGRIERVDGFFGDFPAD
jgi:hypothetical protein